MKKRIFILGIVFSFAALSSFAQKNENAWLKKCTKLTYHLTIDATEYDFVMDSLKFTDDIYFHWIMTTPGNDAGRVKIFKQALDSATAFNNYFTNNTYLELTDKTTVWASKVVYKAIKKGSSVNVDLGNGREKLTFISREKFSVKVNGTLKSFDVLYATTVSGSKIWILDDPSNPLLIKMYVGWTIEIKEITTKE
jgi:hypothetical protein